VDIVATEAAEGALLVHVRDTHSGELALLSPDFWRGFLEIRGRLVLVTVSGFRDRPLTSEEMQTVLRAQLTQIRRDNAGPVTVSPEVVAASTAQPAPGDDADVEPEIRLAAAGTGQPAAPETIELELSAEARADAGPPGPGAPDRAPRPPLRRAALGGAYSPARSVGSPLAPRRTPLAPPRPGQG